VKTIKNKNEFKSWTWGGWGGVCYCLVLGCCSSITKRHCRFAIFLCSIGGLGVIKSGKSRKGGLFYAWCWGCFGTILYRV